MAVSTEELNRVLTQNGMFPNGHAVNRPAAPGDARKYWVTAFGHNGKPMLCAKNLSRRGKSRAIEEWERRSDIARIEIKEVQS
jgi:hypothetical protein